MNKVFCKLEDIALDFGIFKKFSDEAMFVGNDVIAFVYLSWEKCLFTCFKKLKQGC